MPTGQGCQGGVCPGSADIAAWTTWAGDSTAATVRTCAPGRRRAEAIPLGRVATPEDVAGLTAFLASGAAGQLTGRAIDVAGGAIRH